MASPRRHARRRSRTASPHDRSRDRHATRHTTSRSRSPPSWSRRRSRSPRSGRRVGAASSRATTPPAATSTTARVVTVLPAAAHREELLTALQSHQVVVCVGETGSGKTTQIPQYLLRALEQNVLPAGSSSSGRVVVTQPRRVATVAVAQRVANEMGFTHLRDSPVGYTIRFDDQTTDTTRLKFVTDGVLVRECLRDPTLSAYAVVVLDEAHERSLHTDILFGLLKRVLARRPDLRLLVTSATLDAERFAAFFAPPSSPLSNAVSPAPIVAIPGRVFPVDIFHSKQAQVMGLRGPLSTYVRSAIETAFQVHRSEPHGHILVFLTGQHEIEDACAQLRRLVNDVDDATRRDDMELRVLPLYGALSGRTQRDIFQDVPRHVRKLIVATNIAETSLTIDGVRYVIDCGFTKQKAYNPATQLESLVVVPISKVSAQQRAGRAGRTAPGKCFRLYSKASYEEMLDESIPEIRRTNLANTVLYLKVLGVHDVLSFELLDRPDEDALLDALEQLFVLDAIDSHGHVTTMGKLMAQFPLEPKLSRALMEAIALECADDMAAIVAMLSVENVYTQQAQKKQQHGTDGDNGDDNGDLSSRDDVMLVLARDELIDDRGDQLTFLRLLKAFEAQPPSQRHRWCELRQLRVRSLSTAVSVRQQLLDIITSLSAEDLRMFRDRHGDKDMMKRSRSTRLRRALCAGFFSHAARRCNSQSNVYRAVELHDDDARDDSNSRRVQLLHLHPLSTLNYVAPPTVCIYQELVMTSRPFMRDVVEVDEKWVRACAHGKVKISLAQLYALSGQEAPPSVVETSHPKRKPQSDEGGDQHPSEATRSAQDDAAKQSAIDAARARFLARKKPRS